MRDDKTRHHRLSNKPSFASIRAAAPLLVIMALGLLLPLLALQNTVYAQEKSSANASGNVPSWIDPEPFEYNPQAKPNPFQPFLRRTHAPEEEEKENQRNLSPLEKITPSQMKLEGILSQGASDGASALVQLPSGKGYILQKGTEIGTQGARVESIESDRVIIREYYVDVMGERKSKQTVLKLPQSAGEKDE